MLRKQHRFFRSVLVAADATIVGVAVILAYPVRFGLLVERFPTPEGEVISYATHAIPVLTAVPIMLVIMAWCGLYQPQRDQRFFREAGNIVRAVAIGVLVTLATISFLEKAVYRGQDLSRLQYVVYAGLALWLLLSWRFLFRVSLRRIREHGWNLRHVAIIGTGRLGQVVVQTLRRNSWTGITPSYFISHHAHTSREACMDLPVFGGIDQLDEILDRHEISGVFIALPGRMTAELPSLLARLERHAVNVRIVPDMNPRYLPINMAASELEGMPILSVRESPLSGWGGVTKRAVDVLGSVVALTIFGLPMLVIALLVWRSGPGPVVFRQERISLNGQRFKIFKFRTMRHVEAEEQALRDAGRGIAAWTKKNDRRITPIGAFLRRTSLDELPQLFNVFLGEMSLVGPRPERPELIEDFREDWRGYMLRQNVKAGMTGWAQVNGLRGDTSLRKRLQYDLFYVRHWSLWFDVRILWMTVFKGFTHPNAA